MSRSSFPRRSETKPQRIEAFPSAESNSGGYSALPNSLLRVWIPALNGAEIALLMWIVQDTLAWHRDDTKPSTYRLIAKRANVHRHSIERAVGVLMAIGLIGTRNADTNAGAYAQIFTINSFLLQNPPLEFDQLVQKMDRLRTRDLPKKASDAVQKKDTDGPKMGPTLVEKKDCLYEEEIKGLKETKKLVNCEKQELEFEIRERIARSNLSALGGNPLHSRTVAKIRTQLERLPDNWQVKQVLETMEDKCAAFARHPGMAESWGLVVTVVRDAVVNGLASVTISACPAGQGRVQKPWFWMTAEERTAARAEGRTA